MKKNQLRKLYEESDAFDYVTFLEDYITKKATDLDIIKEIEKYTMKYNLVFQFSGASMNSCSVWIKDQEFFETGEQESIMDCISVILENLYNWDSVPQKKRLEL